MDAFSPGLFPANFHIFYHAFIPRASRNAVKHQSAGVLRCAGDEAGRRENLTYNLSRFDSFVGTLFCDDNGI